MAIVYDWYENPNAEGESEERGLHPPSVAQRQSEHGAIILSGTRTQFAQRG